jgi:hypothetical protein
VTGYKLNDFAPYIYVTRDHGESWTRLDRGLPGHNFVRVVREDPAIAGVLYAGTEGGVFVSFDAGGEWQLLELNMPPVPITDLSIRQDTLVAATQGRGFWALDDLFVVRSAARGVESDAPGLIAPPSATILDNRGWRSEEFEASNPDRGVPLYYYLPEGAEGPLSLEIRDSDGQLVRSYSSEESDFERCQLLNMDPRRPYTPSYPSVTTGLNKWTWDGRRRGFPCVENTTLFAGLRGPSAPQGEYTAHLAIGDTSVEAPFTLWTDPRLEASADEITAWRAHLDEAATLLEEVLVGLGQLRVAKGQVEGLLTAYPEREELQRAGQAALEAITAWDHQIIQPLHQTYEDEDAWETMLAGQIRYVLDVIDRTGAPVASGALDRLADLQAEWSRLQAQLEDIRTRHLEPINRWARQNEIPYVKADTK